MRGPNIKSYCVIYMVDGLTYRYRCFAKNKRDAKKQCKDNMPAFDKIIEVYEELAYGM